MRLSQATTALDLLLSNAVGSERANEAVHRALSDSSVAGVQELGGRELQRLLLALACQGGEIQRIAEAVATDFAWQQGRGISLDRAIEALEIPPRP